MPSSIVAVSIYTLSSTYCFLTFNECPSDWCGVIAHCSFDMHFSNNEWCWASFHVFVTHLYVFLGDMSIYVFVQLFDWIVCFLVLSCMSCLYILEINPLSVVSFAIIFPILRVVFSPSYSFLCCAKAFKFNQVPLVYFCFYFHDSRRWVMEHLALIYAI